MRERSGWWSWSALTMLLAAWSLILGCSAAAAQQGGSKPVATAASPTPASSSALAFTGVTVVDVNDGRLLADRVVVVVGNRVRAVGSAGAVQIPPKARLVDARGKYLIPGLWDMHLHVADSAYGSPHILDRPLDIAYPLLIANGVTGVRIPGTDLLNSIVQARPAIAAGQRVGPRIMASLSVVYRPNRCAGCSRISPASTAHIRANSPADMRFLIDSLKTAGVDFIKVYTVPPDIMRVIAEETRRLGISFGGHVQFDSGGLWASNLGARALDHGFGDDVSSVCTSDSASVEKCRPIAERFRRNGTWVVLTPTAVLLGSFLGGVPPSAPVLYRERAARYVPEGTPFPQSFFRDSVRAWRAWRDSAGPAARDAVLARAKPASLAEMSSGGVSLLPKKNRATIAERSGFPILAGSDGVSWDPTTVPGFIFHDALSMLVEGGWSPLKVLQAATLEPARFLGMADSLGTVAPGKLADLVLLDANPLADIQNTTKIRAVVANGRYFDREALDGLLAEAEQQAKTGSRKAP